MQQTTLRGLAKAHAAGILAKDKYRQDRTTYIEAVLSGSITIQPAEQSPVLARMERTGEITMEKSSQDRADVNTEILGINVLADQTPPKMKTGFIIGGAAALLVVVIVVFAAFSGDEQPAVQPRQEVVASVAPPVDTPPNAAQNLIRSFIAKNVWSETSMNSFLAEWDVMPEPEKNSIKNSVELGQLANAIYKKLLEERALSGIGNPETSYEKQRQLVQFAASLDISDSRISLPN
jgi:hypothetical protein